MDLLNPAQSQAQQASQQQGWTQAQIEQAAELARQLFKESGENGPVYSPWAGAARMADALAGKIQMGRALSAQAANQQYGAEALPDPTKTTAPVTTAPSPSADAATNPQGGTAAPSPIGQKVADLTAGFETGSAGLNPRSLANISSDTGGSLSYGPFGLNSHSGSLAGFVKTYGPQLGLTAQIGTPEFNAQWRTAAQSNPDAMAKAHMDWHQANIMGGLTEPLIAGGIAPELAADPRVQAYFADRKVQMGGVGLDRAVKAGAGSPTVNDLLTRVSQSDHDHIAQDFQSYLSTHPNNTQGLTNRIGGRLFGSMSIAGSPAAAAPGGAMAMSGLAPGGAPAAQPGAAQPGPAPAAFPGIPPPAAAPAAAAVAPGGIPTQAAGGTPSFIPPAQGLPQLPDMEHVRGLVARGSPLGMELYKQLQTAMTPQAVTTPDGHQYIGTPYTGWHLVGLPAQPKVEWQPQEAGGAKTNVPLVPTYDQHGQITGYRQMPIAGPDGGATGALGTAGNLPALGAIGAGIEANKAAKVEQAKDYEARRQNIEKTAGNAFEELPQLQMLQKIMADPNFYSGWRSGNAEQMSSALKTLGLGEGQTATAMQLAQKLGQRGSLGDIKEMGESGAVRMPEMQMIAKSNFDPNNTPEANKAVVAIHQKVLERQIEMADRAKTYADAHGGLIDSGFDQETRNHYKDKPLFSDDEIGNYNKLFSGAAKPGTETGAGERVINGKTYFQQNGKWYER